MVSIDPALTLIYREEYKDVLKESRGDFSFTSPRMVK